MTNGSAGPAASRVASRIGLQGFTEAVVGSVLRAIDTRKLASTGPITAGIWVDIRHALDDPDGGPPPNDGGLPPGGLPQPPPPPPPRPDEIDFGEVVKAASSAVLTALDERNMHFQGSAKMPRVTITVGIISNPPKPAVE